MQAKTLHDLEWDLLLDRIAEQCRSGAAADRARSLVPGPSFEEALVRARRLQDALGLAALGTELPVVAVEDLGPPLDRVIHGATATAPEILSLLKVLVQAQKLRRFGQAHAESAPALAEFLSTDPTLERLQETLERALDADGTVSDRASPELARARDRWRQVRHELLTRIEELMHRYQDVLRDRYWAERDGRHVLPVRSDAHFKVPGIVLGSSASGGTLYVEPQEITPLGNRLSVCQADVERAEMRVLAELTALVRSRHAAVADACARCLEADVLAATVRWAVLTDAHAVLPRAEPCLRLIGMRHPLLIGQESAVVPNDLELAAGQALVISGPNAGGKTVALKCCGLAAWMVRAGLPLPARPESVVGWFDPVLTDVGDEQSLVRSLSTFSAHVKNLALMLEAAGPHTLVLVDEVVGGTDPEEGAALAGAVLESLLDRGATVAVTTHYERLKEAAYKDPRFVNASVGFDWQAMAPSFRLSMGVPGPSSALAVAARFGIPESVMSRAKTLLPDKTLSREELVRQLVSEREALARARQAAERETEIQAELTRKIESEHRQNLGRERAQLARQAEDLMAAVRQARADLKNVVSRMRRPDLASGELVELGRRINQAAAEVAVGGQVARALGDPHHTEPRPLRASDLSPGARLFLPRLGTVVEVTEAPQGKPVRVRAGGMRLLVDIDELLPTSAKPNKAEPQTRPRSRPQRPSVPSAFAPVRHKGNTLDLRGERVEDALDLIDAFLDRLTTETELAGFVLHGHGTGKLKAAVRDHLSRSSYIARSRPADPEDGGDAFTVFWLKS